MLTVEKKKKKDGTDALEWVRLQIEGLKDSSSAKQLTVGGATGWTSGFVFGKFGKTAATAVGGSILALHVSSFYFPLFKDVWMMT